MDALSYVVLALLLVAFCAPYQRSRCNFIGALIGAGASLIGGAMNRNAQKKANAANSPVGQVRQWEQAGINPIFGISSGGYIPQQAASIGDAVATAGGIFGQSLDLQHEKDLRQTGLKLENQLLKKRLDKLSEPSEPSHLQAAVAGQKTGGTNKSGPQEQGGDEPKGEKITALAPGRELEVAPVTTGPGFTEMDNALTGSLIFPGADGEPWGIDEVLTVVAALPFNAAYSAGEMLGNAVDNAKHQRGFEKAVDAQKRKQQSDKRTQWGDAFPRSVGPTFEEIDTFRFRLNAGGF